jgi:hypothetical protein
MSARSEKAGKFRQQIERMQKCVEAFQARKKEVFPNPNCDDPLLDDALKRVNDGLHNLWVQIHYLSCETPGEKYENDLERRRNPK